MIMRIDAESIREARDKRRRESACDAWAEIAPGTHALGARGLFAEIQLTSLALARN